jgi:hypothetical protein
MYEHLSAMRWNVFEEAVKKKTQNSADEYTQKCKPLPNGNKQSLNHGKKALERSATPTGMGGRHFFYGQRHDLAVVRRLDFTKVGLW